MIVSSILDSALAESAGNIVTDFDAELLILLQDNVRDSDVIDGIVALFADLGTLIELSLQDWHIHKVRKQAGVFEAGVMGRNREEWKASLPYASLHPPDDISETPCRYISQYENVPLILGALLLISL